MPMVWAINAFLAGVIFGNIVYEGTGAAERNIVVLNDIHIDIMDYISPATCADVQFRNMWAEFEWENKVKSSKGGLNLRGGVCEAKVFSAKRNTSQSVLLLYPATSSQGSTFWLPSAIAFLHRRREPAVGGKLAAYST